MRSAIFFTLGLFITQLVAPSTFTAKKAHLSAKRDGVGGIRVEELFYFAGGFELNDYIPTNIVEIYNITSGEWMEPIFLDEARGFISTAVIDQNIYFIGGTRVVTCATLYNTIIHQYEDIGCGPTVRKSPGQISVHNSTVTILGSFSVDFYNISSKQWYYLPNLTSWMQTVVGGVQVIHENMIIGVGGVNVVTLEQSYDAWIYDIYSNDLIVFANATTISKRNVPFNFAVAHNRLVIYTSDRFIWHQFGTMEWREGFMAEASKAAILPDVLFLFNATGYLVYNWNTELSDFTVTYPRAIYQFDSQVVIDLVVFLNIYEGGEWTGLQLNPQINLAVRWNDKYVFHSPGYPLRLYDSSTKSILVTSAIPADVSSMLPFDDERLLIFMTNKTAAIYYALNDTLSEAFSTNTSTGVLLTVIGTDVVSLNDNMVWVNLTQVLPFVIIPYLVRSSDNTVLFGSLRDYMYIEVYNHVSQQWQPKIFLNITQQLGASFAQAMVVDDILITGRRYNLFRYNSTTGESTSTLNSGVLMNMYGYVNPVPTLNHVAYQPGMYSSTMIQVTSASITALDTQNVLERTTQFSTSAANIIYMATFNNAIFNKIFTYNISSGELETVVLPALLSYAFVASIDGIVLTFGNDSNIYGFYEDSPSTLYAAAFAYSTIPTIIEAMPDGTIMLASGRHAALGIYSDQIMFINASAVMELGSLALPPTVPTASPSYDPISSPVDTPHGMSTGNLVAAIVVPIVIAAGATILIVLLIKNGCCLKRHELTNLVGLESRYGDWFTPFDQITFEEQLGQGGSGQVFKGKWKNTSVALKVSMTQANNSVITELELMMQLRPHPNVVQLFGFSVHPETNSIILIIELCEGGSLDTKLYDNSDEISLQTRVQWLTGIAKGLSHLHSNNIVHRDIAARNVLLNNGEPKLTDFGMSRVVDDQQQHGTTKSELGPIRWMSPESLKNKEYSTKSDVWSFGILMFEVVARQEPHSEADPIEVGRLIRDEGLTPVIPSSCHPLLADLTRQCWRMSPQSRPNIEDLITLLESVQAQFCVT